MPSLNLLYTREYEINEDIHIVIPKLEEILPVEDEYYNLITLLTAMPIDLMVQLDDIGIDFTQINEWDLFLLSFEGIKNSDTHLVFGDLDLGKFELAMNESNGQVVLVDSETGVTIDRAILNHIASILRKIHHLEKNRRRPGNDEAKKYMLERARAKVKRNRNRKTESKLESLIVALVNTEQFKYDFEGIKELSIYQFNESVKQVIKKVDYDNRMYGVYTGAINPKELSNEDLNWLIH